MRLKGEWDMNRRKFLQSAGAGTIALGSLPLLAGKAWAGHDEDEQKGFHFLVNSFGPGTNRLLITGDGTFDGEGNVEGGGSFDNFLAVPPPPDPFGSLGSGTWKARKFVSFTLPAITAPGDPDATHGVFQGGILKLRADFHPVGKKKVKDVLLEVVCNLGPAGASTPGKDEGVTFTLPDGTEFVPKGVGITIFTRNEECDESLRV